MENITINAGWLNRSADKAAQTAGGQAANETQASQANRKSVFGGNLNAAADPIARKRKEAQQKAWDVVQSAWDNDKSADESIESRKAHQSDMEQRKKEAQDGLADINADRDVLKRLYEIDDDSQEQKDLAILEKKQDQDNGARIEWWTDEERERYNEIKDLPRTEYQQRMLELNDRSAAFRIEIEDAGKQIMDDTANIRAIQEERLKHHPMIDAQKQADAIREAANKEVIGMAMEQAKDHIDETMEEIKEKADEAMEKKEEREEKLEELKELRAMQEAIIEGTKEAVEEAKDEQRKNDQPDIEITDMVDIARGSSQTGDVQQSLDDIKNSMKVLEADLKGIKVDEEA